MKLPRSFIKKGVDAITGAAETIEQGILSKKPNDLKRPDDLTPNEVNTISTQLAPEALAKQALDNTQLGRVVDPARHEHRNFSLDSIDAPEDIKEILDNPSFFSESIGALSDNTQSHAETVEKAFESSQTVNDWLKKGSSIRTADELVRGKQLMYLGAKELSEAAKEIKSSQGDIRKEYRFRAMVAKQSALFQAFTGSVNEVGKALNAMKITVGSDDRMFDQMRLNMETLGGSRTTQKMADAILSLGDDYGRINDFAIQNKSKRWTQAINEWISASHLWQPATHYANVVGNMGATMTGVGERYAASGIGRARKLLNGGDEVIDRVKLDEANAMMVGLLEGMVSAPRIFAKAWRDHEKNPDFLMNKGAVKFDGHFKPAISAENLLGENMNSPWGKMIDAVAPHLVRTPFRLLGSADEVFKTMNYNMQSYAHARRSLSQEGVESGTKEHTERMHKILSGEDEVYSGVVNDESIDYAEINTFTNSLSDNLSQSVQRISNSSPLIKMHLPYVRTPTNIIKYATERTLMAPATKQWRDQWNKGGAERDIAASKVMLGSTIQAAATSLMLNTETVETDNGKTIEVPRPKMTGNYPPTKKMRDLWKANGIQPWSIYIDGKYHAYNRLDPIGMQIGMMAQGISIANSFHNESDRENAFMSVAVGLGEYYSDKAYFQSIGDLFNIFSSQGNGSAVDKVQRQIGQKVASTLIPSHLSWLAKSTDNGFVATTKTKKGRSIEHKFSSEDELNKFLESKPDAEVTSHPVARSTKTDGLMNNIINQIKARSPLHRKDLFPQVDMFGNDVIMDSLDWHSHNLSPIRKSEVEHDDVIANELYEQGFGYMTPSSKISVLVNNYDRTVDLDLVAIDPSGKLFYQWQKMIGKERYRELGATISNSAYSSAKESSDTPRIGRRFWLQKAASEGRRKAKQKFINRFNKQLQEAGIKTINSGGGQLAKPFKGGEHGGLERNPFR